MYSEIFTKLGLSKNEARIYETLLRDGESPVGSIAVKSQVNRRNVYDSLNRLVEKGIVFEIVQKHENLYKAVDPRKLMEVIKEKELLLSSVMPELEKLYGDTPHEEDVYVYRGLEGWKNFMRDIIRLGEDVFIMGGKGAWADPRLATVREQFLKDAAKKNIKVRILFDHEIMSGHAILDIFKDNYKFLPQGTSSKAAVTIFGDRVVIQTTKKLGEINDNASFVVVVNKNIADSFRIWFDFMWQNVAKPKSKK